MAFILFRRKFLPINLKIITNRTSSLLRQQTDNIAISACFATSADNVDLNDPFPRNIGDGFPTTSLGYDQLYKGHIPTSFVQKAALGFGSTLMAILDPWRGDMVAVSGESMGYFALISCRKRMMADPVGRQILQEKPVINSTTVNLDYLRTLPENSYGRYYVDWCEQNAVGPDSRPPVHFVDDLDLAYVMVRYRQIHDMYHAMLGMPANMIGEVVVKVVEALQTQLPMCYAAGLLGPIRLKKKHWNMYMEQHFWWAVRQGLNGKFLMNVYFEKEWETPMDELRRKCNLEAPPPTPGRIELTKEIQTERKK